MGWPDQNGLCSVQLSLLCCLSSRSKEGITYDYGGGNIIKLRKCGDDAMGKIFRRRVKLLDELQPLNKATGKPICDHWSIGKEWKEDADGRRVR